MPENKVKFGLKKCYYAVITEGEGGAFSYGTPVAIPGAVSLAANKSGDSEAFEADDKDFWVVSSAQYDITLEVAKLPESFFTDVLMYTADAKGVLWESGAECKRIALLFEQNGDQKPTRYAFLNCLPSLPNVEAETSKKKTPKPTSISMVATEDPNGRTLAFSKSDTDATVYNDWFTTVPTYTAVGG